MKKLRQPFSFSLKLGLLLSLFFFLLLFLCQPVEFKGNQPTACRELLDGNYASVLFFGTFWLLVASALGAFVAAVFGVLKQLFSKHP